MQIDNEDNGWYERGELPPVGVECEFSKGEDWIKCEIIAHFAQPAAMVAAFTYGNPKRGKMLDFFTHDLFRPIKSERERVIEAVIDSLDGFADIPCMVTHNRIFLDTLYRAGFLKLPDGGKS